MSGSAILTASGIGKRFAGRTVLREAELEVGPGEMVGLVGENGSGKTTLLKILVGLLRPDRGDVRVFGKLGYCPQDPLVFDTLTVAENLRFFARAYGFDDWRARSGSFLDRLRLEVDGKQTVSQLSGGSRQKLNLIIALLHQPDILILDEPYSGFDWETYKEFWHLASEQREHGVSVLVVSHLIFESERFDRLLELQDGRLAEHGASRNASRDVP